MTTPRHHQQSAPTRSGSGGASEGSSTPSSAASASSSPFSLSTVPDSMNIDAPSGNPQTRVTPPVSVRRTLFKVSPAGTAVAAGSASVGSNGLRAALSRALQPQTYALLDAAAAGNMEDVKSALAALANPNVADRRGRTAMHFASVGGHVEVLDLLLAAGGDVSVSDANGNTPLHLAVVSNRLECVLRLLHAGRSIGMNLRETMQACSPETYLLYVLIGADVVATDKFHRTPLDLVQSRLRLITDRLRLTLKTSSSSTPQPQPPADQTEDRMEMYMTNPGAGSSSDQALVPVSQEEASKKLVAELKQLIEILSFYASRRAAGAAPDIARPSVTTSHDPTLVNDAPFDQNQISAEPSSSISTTMQSLPSQFQPLPPVPTLDIAELTARLTKISKTEDAMDLLADVQNLIEKLKLGESGADEEVGDGEGDV
ncbi:hypothetical protein HK102_006734 [Quaeritorhiza haematococci]|nr:hypothetical protein HK102_006734 [Quaeritorhiza haematococci]